MRRGAIGFALLAALAAAALARPQAETVAGVAFDWGANEALVEAGGAADRYAPDANIARVKAERTARLVAARRLHAALAALPADRLGCDKPPAKAPVEDACARAPARKIDWGSDGSVRLTLAVPLAGFACRGGAPDGGVHKGVTP